jgi:polysaccharide export outer membrane protein
MAFVAWCGVSGGFAPDMNDVAPVVNSSQLAIAPDFAIESFVGGAGCGAGMLQRENLVQRSWPLAVAFFLLAACGGGYKPVETMPAGADAYAVMDRLALAEDAAPYRVGPDDILRVNVFFEPTLSSDSVKVDRAGQIALPGIGQINAEGMTTAELSDQVAQRLKSGGLLTEPNVAVSIVTSAARKVVVTGQVKQSGVFDLRGKATLLEAIAMAGDETEIAQLDEAVVFRTVNGERMAGRFDIGAIRCGVAEDPTILGNDMVVVGYSEARVFWRDVRQTLPIMGLFIRLSK